MTAIASCVPAAPAVTESGYLESWGEPLIRPLPELILPGEPIAPDATYAVDGLIEVTEEVEIERVWQGNFEMGIAGSEGDSETFNFRIAGRLERQIEALTTTLNLNYKKDTANGVDTANRLFGEARQEWGLEPTPWSTHIHSSVEFDDFQPFDSRVAGDAGFGYSILDTKHTTLHGRFGGGVSHEIGGLNDDWVPEGNLGLEFTHELNKRQTLSSSVDFFPALTDFSDYRVTMRTDWEILLDAETNLSLKVGIIDRYDSTPDNGSPNNLDYSTVFLWSF